MSSIDLYNPIRSVDGVAIPSPTGFQWGLSDISAPDAGRTTSALMQKKRQGQAVTLFLSWRNISISDASTVLKAFNPEYFTLCYLDAMQGGWQTKEFYVGDRNCPLYSSALGVWSEVSFTVIMRDGGQDLT